MRFSSYPITYLWLTDFSGGGYLPINKYILVKKSLWNADNSINKNKKGGLSVFPYL